MSFIIGITETRTFLQIGTASDVLLSLYIDLIESEIEAFTDRNLARGTYTESLAYLQSTFDKTGYTALDASQDKLNLFLDNYPVITGSLTLISGGAEVTQSSFSYDNANGVIRTESVLSDPTATYVAGYTTATAPNDLKLVAFMGVKSLYDNNSAASSGSGDVKSKSIKDFSVTYGNEQTSLIINSVSGLTKTYIASNKHILNKYKRVDI